MGFFDKIASLWGKDEEGAEKQPSQQDPKQANTQQSPKVPTQATQNKGTNTQQTKPAASQTPSTPTPPPPPASTNKQTTSSKPAQQTQATTSTSQKTETAQTAKPATQSPTNTTSVKPAETSKPSNGASALNETKNETKKAEPTKPVGQNGSSTAQSAPAKPPTPVAPEIKTVPPATDLKSKTASEVKATVAPVSTKTVAPPAANNLNSISAKPAATDLSNLGLLDDEDDIDFDSALDAAFDTLTQAKNADVTLAADSKADTAMTKEDKAAVEELFGKIASNYARPVKNFIFELKRGTATKEWIDICKPAMNSISKAAEGMGLGFAADKMVDFEEALTIAQLSEGRVLQGETRDLLLSCYEEIVREMPDAFTVTESEQQREGIIINSLLKQVPDLGRVTVEKLYKAGLTSLDMLFVAKKEEVAVASGTPIWLAERICDKFQEYRQSLEGPARNLDQSGFRSRLVEMSKDLKKLHEGFEHASANEWSDAALTKQKRKLRQERQDRALQINVLLAEMGETELVNEIQKVSFERRIERLDEFISSLAG